MTDSRRPLISGNWKMNCNHFEAIQLVQKLTWALKPEDHRGAEVSVHPPFTDLRSVQTVLEADSIPIALGAQNCHWQDSGAYTGEVSPAMLNKLNVGYVLVGHSERRQFGETDDVIANKAAAVVRNQMTPVLCVGETGEEHSDGRRDEVVRQQVTAGLSQLKAEAIGSMVIAYEPVWAIGTGQPASPDDAQEMTAAIRALISEAHGSESGQTVRIQYGASVKGKNAKSFLEAPDVDGLLVGGASLDPEDFARIVAAAHD